MKLILLVLLSSSYLSGNFELFHSNDILEPDPQQTEERNFVDIGDNKVYEAEDVVYNAYNLQVGRSEDVYVFDWSIGAVRQINQEGVIQEFGGERGAGPGEMQNPTSFSLDENDHIWFADPPNGRITYFDNDARHQGHIRTNPLPYRLTLLNDDLIAVFPSGSDEYLIYIFDKEGNKVEEFGKLLPDQQANFLALSGELTTDQSNNIIYTPNRAGFLASFQKDGEVNFYVETLDDVPYPEVFHTEEGGRGIDPNAPFTTESLNATDDYIYIHSLQASSDEEVGVIDAYSTDDGSYQYSLRLPEHIGRAYVTEGFVYTVSDTTITKWAR